MNIRSRQSGANGKVIRLKMLVMVLAALGLMGGGILVLGTTTIFAMGAQHSTADVVPHLIGGVPQVMCPPSGSCGESKLVRNENGVSFTIDTSFLGDQHPFTVWMLVDDFGTTDTERGGYEIAIRVDGGISQKMGTDISLGIFPQVNFPRSISSLRRMC